MLHHKDFCVLFTYTGVYSTSSKIKLISPCCIEIIFIYAINQWNLNIYIILSNLGWNSMITDLQIESQSINMHSPNSVVRKMIETFDLQIKRYCVEIAFHVLFCFNDDHYNWNNRYKIDPSVKLSEYRKIRTCNSCALWTVGCQLRLEIPYSISSTAIVWTNFKTDQEKKLTATLVSTE